MTSSEHPQRPQLAVSAAIFRDDRVLLVRRARSPGKGFYSLPGGRVEFGESLHAALHREVDEETAIKIDIVGLAGWREVLPSASGGGHYLIMSFAARWKALFTDRQVRFESADDERDEGIATVALEGFADETEICGVRFVGA